MLTLPSITAFFQVVLIDIAMAGDNIAIIADGGQQETVAGTSCAAPLCVSRLRYARARSSCSQPWLRLA